MYRKLTAERIFDGYEWMKDGSVLIVDKEGVIKDIIPMAKAGDDVEHVDGILIPGMINGHCHLELSHLKGVIQQKTGLPLFLTSVIRRRTTDANMIRESMEAAERELYENGIVAVIDICNNAASAALKQESSIHWHSLIEIINLSDANLQKQWLHYNEIMEAFRRYEKSNTRVNLTPHAPYSVSSNTHTAINKETANLLISIHNQETNAENELFRYGKGSFLDFYKEIGVPLPSFIPASRSSLQTYLPIYTEGQTIILVHNTFIDEEDILFAKKHAERYGLTLYYCLCPNANLYIEDKLPPVSLFIKHNCSLIVGTDSYASNKQLSIGSEIATLTDNFPELPIQHLLRWATSNGAKAFGKDYLGSFQIGKKPGAVSLATYGNKITGTSRRIM